MTQSTSRRAFLRTASALAAAAGPRLPLQLATGLAGLGAMAGAAVHAADDYRALVCLYMSGGNDGHNTVVPVDAEGYAEYAAARSTLALPQQQLLAIPVASQGGRAFGLHPQLQNVAALYRQGRAAIVANVGPLAGPTTRQMVFDGVGVPPKLFSHNDQASIWQSQSPEGARTGWGGRLADALAATNGQSMFTAVSAAGNAVFLSGNGVVQYEVAPAGAPAIGLLEAPNFFNSTSAPEALAGVLALAGESRFEVDLRNLTQRSIAAERVLRAALVNVAVPAVPDTPVALPTGDTVPLSADALAQQLRMVAQLIAAAPALGMKRQVFMVSIGGFDTHANQLISQSSLLQRVDLSVAYFQSALQALGRTDSVTLFTASDFGRTLASNGDGSDHGWGSHHFVVGGAVNGGNIYGSFPRTALGTANDVGAGRLLPSTSVQQYAATLGAWFGVSPTGLADALPGLSGFSTANLGFI